MILHMLAAAAPTLQCTASIMWGHALFKQVYMDDYTMGVIFRHVHAVLVQFLIKVMW